MFFLMSNYVLLISPQITTYNAEGEGAETKPNVTYMGQSKPE